MLSTVNVNRVTHTPSQVTNEFGNILLGVLSSYLNIILAFVSIFNTCIGRGRRNGEFCVPVGLSPGQLVYWVLKVNGSDFYRN